MYYFLLVLRVIYCLIVNIVIILTHIHAYTTFILDKQSNLIEFIAYIQFQIWSNILLLRDEKLIKNSSRILFLVVGKNYQY